MRSESFGLESTLRATLLLIAAAVAAATITTRRCDSRAFVCAFRVSIVLRRLEHVARRSAGAISRQSCGLAGLGLERRNNKQHTTKQNEMRNNTSTRRRNRSSVNVVVACVADLSHMSLIQFLIPLILWLLLRNELLIRFILVPLHHVFQTRIALCHCLPIAHGRAELSRRVVALQLAWIEFFASHNDRTAAGARCGRG